MKVFTIFLILIGAVIFLAGCEDPTANKARAVTSKALTSVENSSSERSAKGEALAINPENSKVLFTASKVTRTHDGGFNRFSGTIDLIDAKPEKSRVWIDIEIASVFTDTDALTNHLQTADFFDVQKFPQAKFVSTGIVADAANGSDRFMVTGELELKGEKRSITFPATIKVSPESVAVTGVFSINRKDFGIVYTGKADDLIRDDVLIKLELNTPRAK